ncbi:MAG: hypothetical protein JWO62_1350 [Acidimicrobiaceae bacterium]|nr:hypothetical protein [Acidimicrobiaceae bacterium]
MSPMKRRSRGDLSVERRLSLFMGLLSAAWLVGGIVGIANSKDLLMGISFGLFVFFAWAGWVLSPSNIRRRPPKYGTPGHIFSALFRRLGIRWLNGPDK